MEPTRSSTGRQLLDGHQDMSVVTSMTSRPVLDWEGPTRSTRRAISYLIGGHFNWRDLQRGLLGVFAAAGDQGSFFFDNAPACDRGRRRPGLLEPAHPLCPRRLRHHGRHLSDRAGSVVHPRHRPLLLHAQHGVGRHGHVRRRRHRPPVPSSASARSTSRPGCGKRSSSIALRPRRSRSSSSIAGPETKFEPIFGGAPFDAPQFKITEHRVLAGLRLYMGQSTLLANDRQGATLDVDQPDRYSDGLGLRAAFPDDG